MLDVVPVPLPALPNIQDQVTLFEDFLPPYEMK